MPKTRTRLNFKQDEYIKREYRKEKNIINQKKGVNERIAYLSSTEEKKMVIDGPNKNTRKSLLNHGHDNESIKDINRTSNIEDNVTIKSDMLEYLEKLPKDPKEKTGTIYIDSINQYKYLLSCCKVIIDKQLIGKSLKLILTYTTRCNKKYKKYNHPIYVNKFIKKIFISNGYLINKIRLSPRLRLKNKFKQIYLPHNAAYNNGRKYGTGEVITLFFSIKKK